MDERIWEGLLSTALAILDDLDTQGLGAPEVVMGGGTVLCCACITGSVTTSTFSSTTLNGSRG